MPPVYNWTKLTFQFQKEMMGIYHEKTGSEEDLWKIPKSDPPRSTLGPHDDIIYTPVGSYSPIPLTLLPVVHVASFGYSLSTCSSPWQISHVSAISSALQYPLKRRLHLCSFLGAIYRESNPPTHRLSSWSFWDNGSVLYEALTLSSHVPMDRNAKFEM